MKHVLTGLASAALIFIMSAVAFAGSPEKPMLELVDKGSGTYDVVLNEDTPSITMIQIAINGTVTEDFTDTINLPNQDTWYLVGGAVSRTDERSTWAMGTLTKGGEVVKAGTIATVKASTPLEIAYDGSSHTMMQTAVSGSQIEDYLFGVELDVTSDTLITGETLQLTATLLPADASNTNVEWTSSNPDVAVVDSKGLVTSLMAGTTTITVTTEQGGHTATCNITVEDEVIDLNGITVFPSTVTLTPTQTHKLVVVFDPSDATNKNVTWESDKPEVASVNSEGVITAVAAGTATITAKAGDGMFTDTCTVTVEERTVALQGISVSPTTVSLTPKQTHQLTLTFSPSNATNKNVTWKSSNPDAATVSASGLITAVAAGTAEITATSEEGGFTAVCTVTVGEDEIPATGIEISASTLILTPSQTVQLDAYVTPDNATDKTVVWESDNTAVATVDLNGMITAVNLGEAVITASTANGGHSATCSVVVEEPQSGDVPIENITISVEDLTMKPDETKQLTVTFVPEDATNQNMNWSSSNPTVAEVSDTGMITAHAVGSAIITGTAEAGGLTVTCNVTVSEAGSEEGGTTFGGDGGSGCNTVGRELALLFPVTALFLYGQRKNRK